MADTKAPHPEEPAKAGVSKDITQLSMADKSNPHPEEPARAGVSKDAPHELQRNGMP
jgi:hypothetical protein